MVKTKFDLTAVGGLDAVGEMLQLVREEFASQRVSDVDGVRVDFNDGWVHLRPSNTEPILRLIAEADSEIRARAFINDVARVAGVVTALASPH
jgi:phosphomannomutase